MVETEINSLRGENYKVFADPKTPKKKRYRCYPGPIHWFAKVGEGTNSKVAEWDNIDARYKSKTLSAKQYYWSKNNRISATVRKDKSLSHLFGLVRDDNHMVLSSISKISLNDVELNLPSTAESIIDLDDDHKEVIFDSNNLKDVSLWIFSSKVFNQWAVKVDKNLSNFLIEEKLDLTGYKIKNSFTITGQMGKTYTPDKEGSFTFENIDNNEEIIQIRKPKMWNEEGLKSSEIEHELVEENGNLIYRKYANDKGKDWLILNNPIFYLDSTKYYVVDGGRDGHMTSNKNSRAWSVVRDGSNLIWTDDLEEWNQAVGVSWTHNKVTMLVINRTFINIDTSGVTGTVTSAKLGIYGYSYVTADVECIKSTASDDLDTGDWAAIDENTSFGHISSWNTGDPGTVNEFTITNAYIDIDGITKFCLQDYDYDKAADPTNGNISSTSGVYFSEKNGDHSHDPYLDIEVEAPPVRVPKPTVAVGNPLIF